MRTEERQQAIEDENWKSLGTWNLEPGTRAKARSDLELETWNAREVRSDRYNV